MTERSKLENRLEPLTYQVEDAETLLTYQHGYLWSDPGTGKTITALTAYERGGYKVGVVICPVTALGMWQGVIASQIGEKAAIIRTARHKFGFNNLTEEGYTWIITTFALADKVEKLLREWMVDRESVLILDEAHYVKTKTAKRTQAIFGSAEVGRMLAKRLANMKEDDRERATLYMQAKSNGIAGAATSLWQLTGTPQTRWPDDLYTQLMAGRPEIMEHHGVASFNAFVNMFCVTRPFKQAGKMIDRIVGSRNLGLLKKLLDDCAIVRRKLRDVAPELPPVTVRKFMLEANIGMSEVEVSRMVDGEIVRELQKKDSPMAEAWKKSGMAKAKAVADYALEQRQGVMLIGFWHIDVGKSILENINKSGMKLKVAYVSGAVSSVARDRIRDKANAGEYDIVVGQMAAMNTSWNMQEACSHVVIAEEIPSPGLLEQFIARVVRKGQRQHVQVDHMQGDNRLDTAIVRIRNDKSHAVSLTVDLI
jgi:hypothetical protein